MIYKIINLYRILNSAKMWIEKNLIDVLIDMHCNIYRWLYYIFKRSKSAIINMPQITFLNLLTSKRYVHLLLFQLENVIRYRISWREYFVYVEYCSIKYTNTKFITITKKFVLNSNHWCNYLNYFTDILYTRS